MNMEVEKKKKLQKSYFDVLGLCCPSEVPLIEGVLNKLDGIKDYSVVVPTKTVIVVHDSLLISQIEIVKALNRARLEANIRVYGETSYKNKWPSPYSIASGVLLLLSFLKFFYGPLRWLAVGSVAVGIPPIVLKAVAAMRTFTIDINILVLVTVGGSLALQDYWEAGTIVFLFTIADWLESRASHKATAVMSSLVNVVPQRAVLADTGEEIDANEVNLNTILAVKAGEVIPIDGIVVEGSCEVDEKILTGESFPVPKQKDSAVWASTINLNGYISIKTTAVAEDCVVARMAKIVEEAQNNKSRTQRFMDKCAKYYTPAIVVISALIAIVPLAFQVHNKRKWYHLALVVLVSGCPCALLLSTPVAIFCALSKAATLGVLFKGAEHLENLAQIKIMAFDKTGTITRGEFQVVDFKSINDGIRFNELLYWISSIECKSSHPMAEALIDFARGRGIEPRPEKVEKFENFPGEGIYGKIEDNEIYIGNKKIAAKAGCSEVPELKGYDMEGKSIGYVFMESSFIGIFALSDICRTGAKEAIKNLKSMGIKTVMLTGDCQGAANRAQEQLDCSLDLVYAELLPDDKAQAIKELQKEGPTAMIGDGLNDAPALATADLGISMGVSSSALATETGDIILLSIDLHRIPKAYDLSKKAQRKIYENVAISISTKAGILGLAIAGHPLVWAAVLVDVGTCLLVIFNSMLLLWGTGSKIGNKKYHGSKSHHHCHKKKCDSTKSCSSHKHGEDSHCHAHDEVSEHNHCHENNCSNHEKEALVEIITVKHCDNKCCGDRHKETKSCASKKCDIPDSDHKTCSSIKNHHDEESHRHAHDARVSKHGKDSHCHAHDEVSKHNHCHENKCSNHKKEALVDIVTVKHCKKKCCGDRHEEPKSCAPKNNSSDSDHKMCSSIKNDHDEESHRHTLDARVNVHDHCHESKCLNHDDSSRNEEAGGFEHGVHGSEHCNGYDRLRCSDRVIECGSSVGSCLASNKMHGGCCESFRRECCRRNGNSLTRLSEIVIEQ